MIYLMSRSLLLLLLFFAFDNTAYAQTSLYPAQGDNGKWGFANSEGMIVINAEYDQADYFTERGIALVKKGDKYGFIDTTGKIVMPFRFDKMYLTPELENHFAVARVGGKWGFIDENGKETIPFVYELEEEDENRSLVLDGNSYMHDHMFIVLKLKGKYGAITPANKIMIPFEYDNIVSSWHFESPVYALKRDGKWGMGDTLGKPATPFVYDDFLDFWEGHAVMKRGGKWVFVSQETFAEKSSLRGETQSNEGTFRHKGLYGVIDADGKQVVDFKYEMPVYGRVFSKVISRNKETGDTYYAQGILDKNGKEIVPAIYDDVTQIYNGWFQVKKNDKVGFFDSTAKEVIPVKYDYGNSCGDFFILELDKKEGIYGLDGKEIIPIKYDDVIYCFGDLKAVKLNGKAGFIDLNDKVKIPFKYDDIVSGFLGGFAGVKLNGKIGYVNEKGVEVIPLKYDEVDRYYDNFSKNGYVKLKRDGSWYKVTADGKETAI